MIARSAYTSLWCKSVYSFLEGASHPEEIIEEAHRQGIRSIAVTDRDGVYGIVRAHKKAKELGVHLIVGSEITLSDRSTLILLVQHRKGYANLCRLISKGRLRCPKGTSRVTWTEISEHAGGLIALWGGPSSLIAQALPQDGPAGSLREAFGDRVYALLTRHHAASESRMEHRVRTRADFYEIPTVAGMETLYHSPSRQPLQDVLTCIRHGVTLATAGRLTKPNQEHYLRTPAGFSMLYEDDPASVRRTNDVADRCTFTLDDLRYRYPLEKLPHGQTSHEWLRELTVNGGRERYPKGIPPAVLQQIEKELTLIHELQYEGYFLTMYELVQYCRHKNILCQGRGSAANSAVCYCLGITSVDPTRTNLLFERFLSRERAEPPDIDLDIEHNRREEVIQHVYAAYGRSHAAMVANFVRFRARSAVRDIGKVLGIPETALERCTRLASHYALPDAQTLRTAGLDPESPLHMHLMRLVSEIDDVPRHLSIHPGGFLLGHEPVDTIVPVENATMPDRTVIQWDKEDIEDLGLFKVDLLGLGALNVVHRCLDYIEEHHNRKLTLATIPEGDAKTYAMIQRAETVGIFQIESRGQMSMLPRLKPKEYYDLVIEVSIVRPGPITGGMVHPYLRRRNGEEAVTYPHPCLEPVLKKTLGIPLFQEQVMQVAVEAADYTPGEADQLRRDMAAWRKSGRIERHRERLVSQMIKKGIAREFAEKIFEQIRGFGEYGFPESHAASFALLAYATSWLKCHYPASYLCALLNAQPMGFYSPATLVGEGKREGVKVLPIDVQYSAWDCTLEPAPEDAEGVAIRMGLRYVRGLRESEGDRIVAARASGPFISFHDFGDRTRLERGVVTLLAKSGALRSLYPERRDALWAALGWKPEENDALPLPDADPSIDFPALTDFDTIRWDYRYSSHSAAGHPLEPLRERLTEQGLPSAEDVRKLADKARVRYAGLVICRQSPGTAGGVVFMTLEDETGFVNLVLWENIFKKYEVLAKTQSFLGVSGTLQIESGVLHVIVEKLWVPQVTMQPHDVASRDFH